MPALHGRWYTIRLQLEPNLMSIRCLVDDKTLGVYTPENPELIGEASFGRLVQVQTSPGAQEHILIDDISVYPTGKMPPAGKSLVCLRPPEGLVAWWGGEGNGDNYTGGSLLGLHNHAIYLPGWINLGIRFDSVGWESDKAGYADAQLSDKTLNPTGGFSLETWVFLNPEPYHPDDAEVTSFKSVLERPERIIGIGPTEFAVLRKDSSGLLHFYASFDGELHHVFSIGQLPRGTWLHVAGTYDGTRMNLYLNGVNAGSIAIKGERPKPEWITLSSDNEPLHGMMDEPTIYNRALGPDEVRMIYQAGRDGKCKP
jgi:hypothetical protein